MKILFLNAVCGSGSTGRLVADLASALRTQGHEALIAYGVGQAGMVPPETAFKMNHRPGYYWHNALSRLTDHTGLYSKPQTRYLIRKIQEFQPDVVHLHNLHGYYVNYEMVMDYLSKANIPIVMTLHDCWSFTGHCAYFDRAGCGQWQTRCEGCSQLREYPICYTRGDVSRNFDRKKAAFTASQRMHIAAPSHWLAGLAERSFLGKYPIHVIPNGIDLDIFHPTPGDLREKYGLQNRKILLGVASVWEERKGLKDFLSLSQRLDPRWQIVLVGLTPGQIDALPENITGIRRTENARQLAQLYTAADIFVNPTYEDNFPTVNLEAQACGTPVITYATGGSPETLLSGSGRVVETGDIAGLARAIREGAPKPEGVPFHKKQACEAYLQLYREVI